MPIPLRPRLAAVSMIVLGFVVARCAMPAAARAADINILTALAFKPVLLDLAPVYLARTGNALIVHGDTVGAVRARVKWGEQCDLVILPTPALQRLASLGRVDRDTVTPVAKSGIGVVVTKGATPPDISTVDAFRHALLTAHGVAYLDPESGDGNAVYLAKLFDKLGIAQQIQRNEVLVPDGLAAARVDAGEATLALQQISELRAVENVTYVGPLPAPIQRYRVYAAAIAETALHPEEANALVSYLLGQDTAQAMDARGFQHP